MLSSKSISALLICVLAIATSNTANASQAYGSINNFDCVNDTGVKAYGFDIEIEGIHTKDITYTYDYNHYGAPKISEDNSDPAKPKVLVRYSGVKNPDGTWSAYTAIPAGPIAPTQGHQFTDPSINFGGEHFGVGYYGTPAAVRYNWLVDDGAGTLIHGAPVNVSTPTFTVYPPVAAVPVQVVAVIVPPPPPVLPPKQFGDATWVKEIKTKTHNPRKVRLEDLVGDEPGKPQPWANGEVPEVEMEWKLMQTEFANANNPKGVLAGKAEGLPNGNEIITRRYEFYKYTGPIDAETGEAMADAVGNDGVHGSGSVTYADYFDFGTGEWHTTTTNLSTIEVVGEFFGAQMSGLDAEQGIGLINNLQDGEIDVAYVERSVVVGGVAPYLARITSGALPKGMSLNPVTGILSGTPTENGLFTFTVTGEDSSQVPVSVNKQYSLLITGVGGGGFVFTSAISTGVSPVLGGTAFGDGVYDNGSVISVTAIPNAGFVFLNWSEGGVPVSDQATYSFVVVANRTVVANFIPETNTLAASASTVYAPIAQTLTLSAIVQANGVGVDGGTVTFQLVDVNWNNVGNAVVSSAVVAGVVKVTYTIPASTPADIYTILADYSGSAGFAASSDASNTLSIDPATPQISWNAPSNIVYGTALGNAQLNASANVPGIFDYAPVSGTVLAVGNAQALSVAFTPADSLNYTTASASVSIDVQKKILSVIANAGSKKYGAINPAFTGTLSGVVPGDAITAGFASSATALTPVGTYDATMPEAITPALNDPNGALVNYTVVSSSATLTINPADTALVAANASTTQSASTQTVALSAMVSSTAGSVNVGTVTFAVFDGASQIGAPVTSGAVVAGSANAVFSLPGGTVANTYSILATYNGGGNFASSNGAATLTVQAAALTFTSPATATPAAGNVGDTIQFNAVPSDSNAVVSWNFGDGSSGSGNNVGHVYTLAGTYSVTATATLGAQAVQSKISIVISSLGGGTSTGTMTLAKLGIELHFERPTSADDEISIVGTVLIKAGFSPLGKQVVLNVGGVLRTFILDGEGSGAIGEDSFNLALKPQKKGVVTDMPTKFAVQLKGNFKAALDKVGFKNVNNKKSVVVPIETGIQIGDTLYKVVRQENYRSALNESGVAK